MIPATYPSILDSSNRTKMLVYQVPSITGLTRWVDYIPVKSPASESDLSLANTYANEGFILTSKVNDITGLVPFKDYVPIYLDSTATKAWSADNDGYIPMSELAGLLLDFTTGALDPRIAFTRATNATVTNSAGLITYAPHNLLTYSEQFDNAAWSKTNATITANSVIAPDGTITADKIVSTAVSGLHRASQGASTGLDKKTASIYLKSAEYTTVTVAFSDNISGDFSATINLTTGVVGTITKTGTWTNYTITTIELSNGWWRIILSGTNTTNPLGVLLVYPQNSTTYTGDGVSGVYLWGAQLEIGSTATTYNSTTVKNLLGYSELFDNAAWTKSNSFVQTNLLTFSEDFTVAGWEKNNSGAINPVVTANQSLAPNGYQTADKVVFNKTGGVFSRIQQVSVSTSGITYTFSVWLKSATGLNVNLGIRLDATGLNCLVTNEWQRFTISASATTASIFSQILLFNSIVGNDEIADVYIWGAQLVQGSVAGDYRRTDAAALPVYYPNHNGVVCAEKLVENTVNTFHYITPTGATVAGSKYCGSAYLKAGERTWAMLSARGITSGSAWFDLANGVVGTKEANVTSSSITPVGNGWYRCAIFYTAITTANPVDVLITTANNTSSYTGDGTSGIYIFGAQLSDSASLDPYVLNAAAAPTAAAYYGARFDYDPVTLAPKGLLIEEQRANLFLNSSLAGTNLATQSVTVTAVPHTISFYGTGTVTLTGTAIATVVGTGAYPTRTTLTFTPTAGVVLFTVTGTVQYAQLEIGSFATSFIPTAASQVTRAADVATIQGSNFYGFYNQNEGSVYANYSNIASGSFVLEISDNSGNNRNYLRFAGSPLNSNIFFITNTASQAQIYDITAQNVTTAKTAYGYKQDSFAVRSNGGASADANSVDSSGTTAIMNKLNIGSSFALSSQINGTIKQISYYPQRLSNSVLQGLTA